MPGREPESVAGCQPFHLEGPEADLETATPRPAEALKDGRTDSASAMPMTCETYGCDARKEKRELKWERSDYFPNAKSAVGVRKMICRPTSAGVATSRSPNPAWCKTAGTLPPALKTVTLPSSDAT